MECKSHMTPNHFWLKMDFPGKLRAHILKLRHIAHVVNSIDCLLIAYDVCWQFLTYFENNLHQCWNCIDASWAACCNKVILLKMRQMHSDSEFKMLRVCFLSDLFHRKFATFACMIDRFVPDKKWHCILPFPSNTWLDNIKWQWNLHLSIYWKDFQSFRTAISFYSLEAIHIHIITRCKTFFLEKTSNWIEYD